MQPPALSTIAHEASIHDDLHVYDVTLRDGIQAPGARLSPTDAEAIAANLDEAGVRYLEAGIPARAEDRERIERIRNATVDTTPVGLAKVTVAEVDAVIETGLDSISLYAGGSAVHRDDETVSELADRVEAAVLRATDHGLESRFAVTDAGRTPPSDLWPLLDAADRAGADVLGITDSVGVLTPRIVTAAVSAVDRRYDRPVSVHLHNDLGSAGGNAIAAAEAGAAQVHTTVDGIGPMAGNTALAPFATAMAVHHGAETCTLSALPGLSNRVAAAVGVELPASAPVVGWNVFRYTTPARAERTRQEPRTFEGFPPELVGRERTFAVD